MTKNSITKKKYYRKSMKAGAPSAPRYTNFAGKSCTNNTNNAGLNVDDLVTFLEENINNILFNDTRNLYCYSKDLITQINKNNIIYNCRDNNIELTKSFIQAEPGKGLFGITSIPDNAIISLNNVLKVILESPDKVFYIARTAKNKPLQTISYKTSHNLTGGKLVYGNDGGEYMLHNRPHTRGDKEPVWYTRNKMIYKAFHLLIRLLHLMGRNAHTSEDGSGVSLENSRCTKKTDISTKYFIDTDKFTFTNSGSFGIGMEYQCSMDGNTYIAKAILPNNTIEDIRDEINVSKRFATSGSPFIAQFLFALSFADRMFTSKNDGETMPLSNLYKELKRVNTSANDQALFDLEYPLLNEHIERNIYPNMPVGIIAMEKGVNVLENITNDHLGKEFFSTLYNYGGDDIDNLYPYSLVTFIMELSLGFYYFQRQGYTHGDFKFDNCVYNEIKYKNVNNNDVNTAIPLLIDLGLVSNGIDTPPPGPRTLVGTWFAGALFFRPNNIKHITSASIEPTFPHDKNLDVYSLTKAMSYYIWRNRDSGIYNWAKRPVFNYPDYLLDVFENMENQDSALRPDFETIINVCYRYLRSTITNNTNMFHIDNLCFKYLNYRGTHTGYVRNNYFYKADNIHIFNINNFPQVILDHIDTLYTPDVAPSPTLSPSPRSPSPRSPSPRSPSPRSPSPRSPSPRSPPATVRHNPRRSPLPSRSPLSSDSFVSARSPGASPSFVSARSQVQSKNCTTNNYDIYEIFSEINPDNYGEHMPNQTIEDMLQSITLI